MIKKVEKRALSPAESRTWRICCPPIQLSGQKVFQKYPHPPIRWAALKSGCSLLARSLCLGLLFAELSLGFTKRLVLVVECRADWALLRDVLGLGDLEAKNMVKILKHPFIKVEQRLAPLALKSIPPQGLTSLVPGLRLFS